MAINYLPWDNGVLRGQNFFLIQIHEWYHIYFTFTLMKIRFRHPQPDFDGIVVFRQREKFTYSFHSRHHCRFHPWSAFKDSVKAKGRSESRTAPETGRNGNANLESLKNIIREEG